MIPKTNTDKEVREEHPHLHLFDHTQKWKYLIIGTFPPNTTMRDQEKLYIDYFYGNKGFLWKIIHDIYHPLGYDFFKGTKLENLSEIKRWQTDTIQPPFKKIYSGKCFASKKDHLYQQLWKKFRP